MSFGDDTRDTDRPGPPAARDFDDRDLNVIEAALALAYAARHFAGVDARDRYLYNESLEQFVACEHALQLASRRLIDPDAEGVFSQRIAASPPPTLPVLPPNDHGATS